MNKLLVLLLMAVVIPPLASQNTLTAVFYNCENFFDTADNPLTQDEEFLPTAETKWDQKKYFNKIKRISQVMDSTVFGVGIPDVMGFCEIENVVVLNDLIKFSQLKNRKYKTLASTGADTRGINVGFIYDEKLFSLLFSEEISATDPTIPDYKTRNILHVQLKHLSTNQVFSFFVNHWSSRRDGEKETEAKRLYAARQLRVKIDEQEKKNPGIKIIAMGDFNDTPANKSLSKILKAVDKPKQADELLNPFALITDPEVGTHFHAGKWQIFDQIVLNQNCLKGNILKYKPGNAFILNKDFVMFKNTRTGETKPNRTYGPGNRYYNGYSDHLAVYLVLN
jgi:predicted extracellular nuclease